MQVHYPIHRMQNRGHADAMLRDVLCRRLGDPDIRLDLLSNKNQNMTLEQVFRFVEAKEVEKHSITHILVPQHIDALSKSTYFTGRGSQLRRARHLTAIRAKNETCICCGKGRH